MFERYVNFEFYKTTKLRKARRREFERYVNFEFYKTVVEPFSNSVKFERYVNFEFYKTDEFRKDYEICLRDM